MYEYISQAMATVEETKPVRTAKHGKRWVPEDDAKMIELLREGTYETTAAALERSEDAIHMRLLGSLARKDIPDLAAKFNITKEDIERFVSEKANIQKERQENAAKRKEERQAKKAERQLEKEAAHTAKLAEEARRKAERIERRKSERQEQRTARQAASAKHTCSPETLEKLVAVQNCIYIAAENMNKAYADIAMSIVRLQQQ